METNGKNDKQTQDMGELPRWEMYIAHPTPTCFLSNHKLETAPKACMYESCMYTQEWQKTSNSEAGAQFKAPLLHEPFMYISIYPQAPGAAPRVPAPQTGTPLGAAPRALLHHRHAPCSTTSVAFTFHFETRSWIGDLSTSAPKLPQVCSSLSFNFKNNMWTKYYMPKMTNRTLLVKSNKPLLSFPMNVVNLKEKQKAWCSNKYSIKLQQLSVTLRLV